MMAALPVLTQGDRAETSRASVSIVITCFNQGQFLAEAIASALQQSLRHEFQEAVEVLVVDDGSTDDTRQVAQSFPEVRYIFQANSGLPAARNTGLALCTGEYVCFLDADDVLLPLAAETGRRALEQHPECAFAYGDYLDVDAHGRPCSKAHGLRAAGDHYRRLLEGNFIAMHASVVYRRSVLQAAGGFDPGLRFCEDYELYLRLTRQYPVHEHPHIVAHYRQHSGNMSHNHAAMMKTAIQVVQRQQRYLKREPAWREAARRGRANWRDYYGGLIFRSLHDELAARGISLRAGRRLVRVLWNCPEQVGRRLARRMRRFRGRHGINLGDLRRVDPFSRDFGYDRGSPIDRYYIEKFLATECDCIRGAVLEIADDAYTRRFGGARVKSSDVLDLVPGRPGVTITADLARAGHLPANAYDCIILTQTIHFIYDLRGALTTLWHILKPGGCLLLTTPGISQISRDQADPEGDSWRLTVSSARKLCSEHFEPDDVRVHSYGNVLAAAAFLYGLASCELTGGELEHNDGDYPLVIAVKATKTESQS